MIVRMSPQMVSSSFSILALYSPISLSLSGCEGHESKGGDVCLESKRVGRGNEVDVDKKGGNYDDCARRGWRGGGGRLSCSAKRPELACGAAVNIYRDGVKGWRQRRRQR